MHVNLLVACQCILKWLVFFIRLALLETATLIGQDQVSHLITPGVICVPCEQCKQRNYSFNDHLGFIK